MKLFRLIIKSLKSSSFMIILYVIFSLLVAYLTTFMPVIIQYFLDVLLKQQVNNKIIVFFIKLFDGKLSFIPIMCILLIIVEGIIIFSTYLRTIIKNKIIQEFQYEIKFKLFNHIQNLTYHDFYKSSLADLVQNSTDDVNNIVGFIEKQLTFILDLLLIIIFAIGQLSNLNLYLSIVMINAIAIIIACSIYYFKKSRAIIDDDLKSQRNLYEKLNDNYSNIKFMKINNLEDKELQNFNIVNNNNYEINRKKVVIDSLYKTFTGGVVKTQTPVILLISSILFSKKLITVGSIYITINYSNKITSSFIDLSEILETFNLCIASCKRLNQLLSFDLETDDNKDKNIVINDTTISFNNVNIKVNGTTILKNLNFMINPNEKVMIIGSTGSGKTTLINLIPRFYDLTDGNIFINGVDYKEYKLNELRKNISYVFQEPVILNMSIKENLNYGLENISFEEIRKICIKLGLDNKIMSLPNKYDTIINSKTDLLSFGEKQLLSYARAILKNGDIVILDEVTSNLDLEFEQNILSANKELLKGKISFIIAHRLNTIKDADLIIFIENKHIIEAGTHEELLKLNGKYSKLFLTK